MGTEELTMTELNPMAAEFAGDRSPGAAKPAVPVASTASISEAHRRINTPNLVLVGLFVAGIACLYLLSMRAGPSKASAEEAAAEAKVDAALSQLAAIPKADDLKRETSAIVDTFYYEAKQRQIPLDKLACNAFAYKAAASEAESQSEALGGEEQGPPVHVHQDEREAMAAASQLKLQSVLSGWQGATAMISNNLLSEGQVINGWTVKSIESRQVVMAWKDKTYVLKMPR